MKKIYNGVYKLTFGTPEKFTPISLNQNKPLDKLNECSDVDLPFDINLISFKQTKRGLNITIPLDKDEMLYGFGLQLLSFLQNGKKRIIRTNADPKGNSGDSHAPVPFYVSNRGYGVFVDSARYVNFHCGTNNLLLGEQKEGHKMGQNTDELYNVEVNKNNMLIEVPYCEGVDIYIFCGNDLKDAVCRYNLFSGGGVLPPLWGLGFLYRGYGGLNQEEAIQLANTIRTDLIPCDTFGLEPGWHSHAYSCTFTWSDKFPNAQNMINWFDQNNFKINLWEQAFVYHEATIYDELIDYSGDYLVWEGLVPDFTLEEAKKAYSKPQNQLIEQGISAFKLDECDNSDYTGGWSFPEASTFPSGLDGELMHNQLGMLFSKNENQLFKNKNLRTYGQVRALHALASPVPFVLYSDLYDNNEFMCGLSTAGFSGLLWSPEVREARSANEFIRRLQMTVVSPLTTVNAWMLPNPPWKQFDLNKNLNNSFLQPNELEELTRLTKEVIELRMSLIPYLYTAFYKYKTHGIPPFRALVMDYPDDENTYNLSTQIMVGDSILAAPALIDEKDYKTIYLPCGNWYDFYTGELYNGNRFINKPLEINKIPLFVKENTILPLAKPVQHTKDVPFNVSFKVFGTSNEMQTCLYEDDGVSHDYTTGDFNIINISYKDGELTTKAKGNFNGKLYNFFV